MLQVIPHLVLHMVIVKVVWVLGPVTSIHVKIVVGLVVVILCHIRLGIIQQWSIQKDTGILINYLRRESIILVLLVIVGVVFVLGQPTYTPRKLIM